MILFTIRNWHNRICRKQRMGIWYRILTWPHCVHRNFARAWQMTMHRFAVLSLMIWLEVPNGSIRNNCAFARRNWFGFCIVTSRVWISMVVSWIHQSLRYVLHFVAVSSITDWFTLIYREFIEYTILQFFITVQLPNVRYDVETSNYTVNENERKPLTLNESCPVATTCSLFDE